MFKKCLAWCDEYAEKLVLAIGLLLIIHIVFLQTAYRYVFSSFFSGAEALIWTEETARLVCVWITYLGLPLCVKYAKSVRVTILYEVMPQRIKAVLDNLGAFVFLLLCYIIVAKGCTHIQMVREFKQATPMLGLPQYIPYLILPIAFSLTAMRLLQEIWKNVRESGWLNVLVAGLLMAALFVPVYLADEEGNAAAFMFGYFLLFTFLSVPLGVAIGLACIATIWGCGTLPIDYVATTTFTAVDSFTLMAVPFFIAAGTFMGVGGLSTRLIRLADGLLGRYYGGMAMASILTCMFFAAISGSGPATVAAIGCITIPAMLERGYSRKFATAIVAAAGIMGVIIPPSNPLLLYGITAQESIVKLFAGGLVPGMLCGVTLMLAAYLISRKNGWRGGDASRMSKQELLHVAWNAKWALAVPVIILGGIYCGIMTPTEAAAVAAFYGLYVGLFVYREIRWSNLLETLTEPIIIYASINIIFAMANLLGNLLTIEQIPVQLAEFVTSVTRDKFMVLLLLNLGLIVVGTFMEPLGATIILTPILLPVIKAVGIHPVHFGVIMTLNLAIGFLTPPIGMNLFIASTIGNVSVEQLSRGVLPFLALLLVVLALVNVFPQITLFLPSLIGR